MAPVRTRRPTLPNSWLRRGDPYGRSLQLLAEYLTDKQLTTLIESGWFEIKGSKGNAYVIRVATTGNVYLKPGLRAARTLSFCAMAAIPGGAPIGDQLLAQKVLLETDEDAFRNIACTYGANAVFF